MIAFIVATFALLGLMLLTFWLGSRAAGTRVDTASVLRTLLVARAEGQLTAEEFDRQQAALYASVLNAPRAPAIRVYLFLIPIAVAATMAALYASNNTQQSDQSSPSPAPMSGRNENAPRQATGEMQDLAQRLQEKLAGTAPPPHPQAPNVANDRPGGDMQEMAKRLADRLASDPKNGSGWSLLARSYVELRRYPDAEAAFAKAAALLPADATLLADWADAYVIAHDRKWDKRALEIVNKALSVDAKNLKALALAGSAAFSAGNYKEAAGYWTRMKAAAPAGSMEAKEADANLNEARAKLGGKSAQPAQ
jgi:cytochrome c-type biogenesis protein CcmH